MDNHKLSTIQLDILHDLYRFRFLTSFQLQKLLTHKTIRLTNYHLQLLTSKNYIGKHYTRSLGLANIPAVYFLTTGSIQVLEQKKGIDKRALKRIYREKIRSQQFIAHSSFVAEYFLHLRDESEKTKHTLHFFTKTDLLAHPYMPHPLPDAYFARVDSAGTTKRYIVEVVEDSLPRFALRKRVQEYCDYIDDEKFEKATSHPFPAILFICPGYAGKIYLKKHIARMYEETPLDQVDMYLATREGAFSGHWEKVEAEDD